MTAVYSGGLVYEYSEEGSKYGLVTISGSTVSEGPDFAALVAAFKGTVNPTGDGGYNAQGASSTCPSKSASWNVTGDALPAIPSAAAAMMKAGAGKGAGLTGLGSQNGGGTSTGTSTAGSGTVSGSAATSKSAGGRLNAGPMDKSPLLVSAIVIAFSCLGAALL